MGNIDALLFPAHLTCMGCDAVTWGPILCPACTAALQEDLRMPEGCPDCGGGLSEKGTCPRCEKYGVLTARSVWRHALTARTLVHTLKFQGVKAAAEPLIAGMAEVIQGL